MNRTGLPAEVADFARSRVAEALGADVRLFAVSVLQQRSDYWVLLVELPPDRRLVLKLAGRGAEHPVNFARTAAVSELLRSGGTPVSAVLATGEDHWRWQLLEHVEGVPWVSLRPELTDAEVDDAHRQIARAVLAIQSHTFDGFGELSANAQPATAYPWIDALRERAAGRVPDDARRAAFLDLLDREAALFAGVQQATLCHDDLHRGNLLFAPQNDQWRLVSVLDWDKAWAGHAESDVARMAFWDDMTGPGFWAEYRAAVPADEGAERRALIYQLLWCLEYDVQTTRHQADTARLLRALGMAEG